MLQDMISDSPRSHWTLWGAQNVLPCLWPAPSLWWTFSWHETQS